jgi:hypothetical protein
MKLRRRTFWRLALPYCQPGRASQRWKPAMLRNVIRLATCLAALAPAAASAQVGKHLDGCFFNGHQVPCDGGGNDGGYSCDPGYHMTPSGSCLPNGYSVDCGSFSCKAGSFCGSNHSCIPAGAAECGNGYCPSGQKCTSDEKCIATSSTECSDGHTVCSAGSKCADAGDWCIPVDAEDCGNGHYCNAHRVCTPVGCKPELPSEGAVTYNGQRDRLEQDINDLNTAHDDFLAHPPPAPDANHKVWNRFTGTWEIPTAKGPLRAAWDNKTTLYNSLLDALKIIGSGWFMAEPNFDQRLIFENRVQTELGGLMKRDVQAAINLMIIQVNTLSPFAWDSPQLKEEKQEVMEKETRALKDIESATIAHLDGGAFVRMAVAPGLGGGVQDLQYMPGKAIQQLNDIKDKPFWEDCSELLACHITQ